VGFYYPLFQKHSGFNWTLEARILRNDSINVTRIETGGLANSRGNLTTIA